MVLLDLVTLAIMILLFTDLISIVVVRVTIPKFGSSYAGSPGCEKYASHLIAPTIGGPCWALRASSQTAAQAANLDHHIFAAGWLEFSNPIVVVSELFSL
jgi:hypothetical protein